MAYEYIENKDNALPSFDHFFRIKKSSNDPEQIDLIIPDCTPGLMFIKEGSIQRKIAEETITLKAGKVYLFGQKISATFYQYNENPLDAFGVKLFPSALYGLSGVSAHELTNKVVELDRILPNAQQVADWLIAPNPTSCLPSKPIPEILHFILKDIHKRKGLIEMQELSEKYSVHYKSLERLFKLHVGLAPKLYSRMVRFNYSVKMNSLYGDKLTDLAYQSGYYDQNHFIKEVKHFTGLIPSKLFNKNGLSLESDHVQYLLNRSF